LILLLTWLNACFPFTVADASITGTRQQHGGHYFEIILNIIGYSVGTDTRVSTVAKPSPAMIVIDMLTENTSDNSGIKSSMVECRTNKNPFPNVDRVRPGHPTVANPRFGTVSARITPCGWVEIV
jgi:hypothetical protein